MVAKNPWVLEVNEHVTKETRCQTDIGIYAKLNVIESKND